MPVRDGDRKQLNLTIEPRTTLLDAWRMRADLTGNSAGATGARAACTMIVDGRAVYSCSDARHRRQGKEIRNVDGLATASGLRAGGVHDGTP